MKSEPWTILSPNQAQRRNNTWGMIGQYKEGTDHTQSGVGIVHNNICTTAAFHYENTALGWKLVQLSSKGPLHFY
ncbi:MAG: hypothetical protein ACRDCN_05580 [Tannerellaceae bacterium]